MTSTPDEYEYRGPDALGHIVAAYTVKDGAGFDERAVDLCRDLQAETAARGVLVTTRLFRRFHAFPVPDADAQNQKLEGGPLRGIDVRQQVFNRVLYISCPSLDEARRVHDSELFQAFTRDIASNVTESYTGLYRNTMSFAYVSADPKRFYLFNFFSTDGRENAVDTWKRTSTWFYDYTACLSSYNMEAVEPDARYGLVNFAHWNQLFSLYFSAIFRRSMKPVVVEGFRENRMISRPILFREIDIVDRLLRRGSRKQ